jgi:AraC-like DNA-binding protein
MGGSNPGCGVGPASGSGFRLIGFEPEWIPAGFDAPRHRHLDAYATILLEGAYEQSAYAGRLSVSAGDVLVQPTLDAHADRLISRGVRLLRLPWPRDAGLGGVWRPRDLDTVIRVARRDVVEASALLAAQLRPGERRPPRADAPHDRLAAALVDGEASIGLWAERSGVRRETVSRRFLGAYGVTPARFRAEQRARQAWLRATGSREPLAVIAADLGFTDQAHMTRSVRFISGDTPAAWRRRMGVTSVQDEAAAA